MSTSLRNKTKLFTAERIAFDQQRFLDAFGRGEVDTDKIVAPRSPLQPAPVSKFDGHAAGGDGMAGAAGGGFGIQAATAFFNPGAGLLTAFGDSLDNTLVFGRNAAGSIFVNGGAIPVAGGTPTVANTNLIQAFGLGGNDVITLDETNGALPRANLFGGSGNDMLTGGSGGDLLFGQTGNDTLNGRGGNDQLFGGSGNDVLTGGDADDQMFGEAGDDRMIWNPGDDNDLMEGGSGIDTAEVNGGNGAENFTVVANGARVRFDRVDPAPFSVDIGTTENLVVNMNGGDDTFSASGNLSPLIKLTVDGGTGNDTILGGNGIDLLIGGEGNDFIDGNQGDDVALLGAGDDVFRWDPGDGSDTIEGQDGNDTLLFNGSGANEIFEASANGGRVRFTRNVGNIIMDNDDVETIEVNALGGADTVIVNDLSGTDTSQVAIDLAGVLGGTAGDGQVDSVIANATNGGDFIDVFGSGGSYFVLGTPAIVSVAHSEAGDALVVNGLGGDDRISASSLAANTARLTIDGGAGDDVIFGSAGNDVLLGGDGDDFIDGNQGDDVALLGAGNDIFLWDPGDGSDTVEGQAGTDVLVFNGSSTNETMDLSANSGRLRLTRDVGNIVMDTDDVERVVLRASGGSDNITINDLNGTDVNHVEISLIGFAGQPSDGQLDTVRINTGAGDERLVVHTDRGLTTIDGGPAQVQITGTLAADDRLQIDAGAGNDVIDASLLDPAELQFTAFGGLGNDVFIGSGGNDVLFGQDGDDIAFMGAGDDVFVWNPGDDDDTIEGQAGVDTMLFNGAGANENIDISANGGRVRFFRDVAAVTMDTDDVERIEFNALGGADNIVVNDLSGTDVTEVAIDLGVGGAGDGQADTITALGSNGDDVAVVTGAGADLQVDGLSVRITVTGAEAANDRVTITALAGDDVVDASSVAAGSAQLTLDGGAGSDVLLGGAGNDVLIGDVGDDVLIGGAGDDVLLGGDGDDVLIGGPGSDALVGGAGDDIFVSDGDDIVIDGFVVGACSEDRIDLRGYGDAIDYDWLMAHASSVDGNTVIDFGDQQITLLGIDAKSLHQDDFLFG